MTQHDHYEHLCALASSGQIAPDELKLLKLHMQSCGECRNTYEDFNDIATHVLPEFGVERRSLTTPTGMTARFIARAHSEGIPLSRAPETTASEDHRRRLRVFLIAASPLLAFFLGARILRVHWSKRPPAQQAVSAGAQNPATAPPAELTAGTKQAAEIAALQRQVNALASEIKSAQRSLEDAESEKVESNRKLTAVQNANEELRLRLADRDAQVVELNRQAARTKAHIDELAAAKANDEFLIQTGQSELSDLRARVAVLTDEVNERQQLSAAAEQAKDLIVARKLHIVDVDDTDGNGKQLRPFGRIFYTEGRNLVFYAYDLADPRKVNAKINFYVWGSREGINASVRSLGIFHADDEKDGRWVLKFDDPSVLGQINCVFVTAESNRKHVTQPTGHQILFASLGPKPNHP